MKIFAKTLCVVVGCSMLSACVTDDGAFMGGPFGPVTPASTDPSACPGAPEDSSNKEVLGTLLGIGLGAALGSRFGGGSGMIAAAVAGAAIGGLLGNQIGTALDQASRTCHENSIKRAVINPDQGQQKWHLDNQQAAGSVTPLRSFNQDGKQCTEVMQTVEKNGKTISDTNSYCKEADGSVTLLN